MATAFYNQATLSYNGNIISSNRTEGEIIEVLSATKDALVTTYNGANDKVTYVINIVNSGTTDFTALTLSDNLGSYTATAATAVPLTYIDGSLKYYVNGSAQTLPTVAALSPLTITGISVPANSNAQLIYEAFTNTYAPLAQGGSIENTASINGTGISSTLTASQTITPADASNLSITKSVSPTTVAENGTLTYTFNIENTGSRAITTADDVIVSDTFNPILDPLSVTFNGTAWAEGTNYSYSAVTGAFASLANQITVPAASYSQNSETGEWSVSPGIATLVISGTL